MPPPDIEELRERYTKTYIKKLKKNFRDEKESLLNEILKIGRENSQGPLWIAGGGVYRPIIEGEYGIKTRREKGKEGEEIFDIDIAVNYLSTEPYSPRALGWSEWRTRFGDPAYRKGNYIIALNNLSMCYPIVSRKLEPTIENLLKHAPLNIQAIAWPIYEDFYSGKLIGDTGIMAIHNRIVRVNDIDDTLYNIHRIFEYEGKTIEEDNLKYLVRDFIRIKAAELGFDYDESSVLKNPKKNPSIPKKIYEEVLRKMGFMGYKEKLEKLLEEEDKEPK